jgi:mannose-6-phosphate isomerase-like protein (cupin superfamily)
MTATIPERWFENPAIGQRARIVTLPSQTNGRSFVLEYTHQPFTGRLAVPAHVHPQARETFEILSGRAKYRVGSMEGVAERGETIVMPAGVTHVHPWSDSDEELRVIQTAEVTRADLRGLIASLQAAITIFGLAEAGRVNQQGAPPLLQLAVLLNETMPATYLATPSIPVQRIVFAVLGMLGRALGYRLAYPEYGILTAQGVVRG